MRHLPNLMIDVGSVLMAYNIYRYVRFSRHVRERGNWDRSRRLFALPILLLILFLAGYLSVTIFGRPDFIIAFILLGGSIFVLIMLLLIQRAVDQIQENEQLEAKLAATEEASRAKSFFLSNMSHDIRTPLNAIIGYTALANREGVTAEDKTEYINKIENAGRQLLDIVNDVLEMSRIENGKMVLEPSPCDLEAGIQEAGDLVRTQLESKRILFQVTCSLRHRWVLCDRNHLNRVLMNLLCNAGKFTGEGGSVTLSCTEVSDNGQTADYRISVRDTGIGMSPEFVEHIFTPFEREQTSTVSRTQGTGLGMAITKSIVDEMGGRIDIVTEQGKGSEFILSLSFPIAQDPGGHEDREAPGSGFSGTRLLLVEDNEINMEIAQLLLLQAGFLVETALNGQQAVDMVSASAPGTYDAVLMDIQMPVMDGYAASRAIRALDRPDLTDLPIIAMTANAFQEDIQAAESAGMDAHIAKPLDIPVMMDTLQRVLSARSGIREGDVPS